MDLTLNLEGVSSGFPVLPPGDYKAVLTDFEGKKFSTGSVGASLEFTIIEDEFQGQKVWANLVVSDKARWKIKEFLEAMELWTPEELESTSFNLGQALIESKGEEITLRTGQREWEGELRTQVNKFLPA